MEGSPHGVAVDRDLNVYVASVDNGSVENVVEQCSGNQMFVIIMEQLFFIRLNNREHFIFTVELEKFSEKENKSLRIIMKQLFFIRLNNHDCLFLHSGT